MKWNDVLTQDMVIPDTDCQLIVVGETKEGGPFCYEDSFRIEKVTDKQLTVSFDIRAQNPFDRLEHVTFVEYSFRERGVQFYSFVQLLQMETHKGKCLLTLSAPEELHLFQNRRYNRITLPVKTPVMCKIVGIRSNSAKHGISFTGTMLDLCAGGLALVTNSRMFKPLFLEVSFHLPDEEEKFLVSGEVLRVTPYSIDSYRVALEFRDTPESLLQRIHAYCERHA
ncbi:PilZ domain-containing protein [Paenibacillus sp. MBLB4367]|uniref:PilZ domain-containing protein n=1 Tax=Paenibacillus sp. MBLB4367 TaxID=3384767 RepID=UPI0039080647